MIHFCKLLLGFAIFCLPDIFLWRKFDDRLFFTWALAKAKFAKARPSFFGFLNFSLFLLYFCSSIFGACMLSLATKKCHLKRMKDEFLQ
ncbi:MULTISPECIES: hypothetical protein [Campylobacter]|uniref:hypothetical protein n=1 Tax=Campylobacter TaxID=194 RepID=UPI000555D5E9|nr:MULTISPECIES: hypothetical protein [Campylobacter]